MSETPEVGANGVTEPAAAAATVELSPKEQRKLRERARREYQAKERERLKAEAEAKAATATTAKPTAAAVPERTPEQLQEDAGVFLRGVLFPLISVLARPFGFRLDLARLTERQAHEDGAAWVPVLRLYGWLRAVVTWTGIPARLFARVRELAERRESPKEKTP